jgi:hypothetical protein
MGLGEIENYLVSKATNQEYAFGETKGLKEFVAPDSSENIKLLLDIVDFVWKGAAITGGRKIPGKAIDKLKTTFLKDVTKKYNLPKKIYLSPEKVRSVFGVADKITKQELDMLKTLGLSSKQYRTAIKEGVDIEIPIQKITTLTDKTWYASLKKTLKVKPFKEVKVEKKAPIKFKRPVAGMLEMAKPEGGKNAAKFKYWWDIGKGKEPIAMYQIPIGKGFSDVAAKTLKGKGYDIPKTPTFKEWSHPKKPLPLIPKKSNVRKKFDVGKDIYEMTINGKKELFKVTEKGIEEVTPEYKDKIIPEKIKELKQLDKTIKDPTRAKVKKRFDVAPDAYEMTIDGKRKVVRMTSTGIKEIKGIAPKYKIKDSKIIPKEDEKLKQLEKIIKDFEEKHPDIVAKWEKRSGKVTPKILDVSLKGSILKIVKELEQKYPEDVAAIKKRMKKTKIKTLYLAEKEEITLPEEVKRIKEAYPEDIKKIKRLQKIMSPKILDLTSETKVDEEIHVTKNIRFDFRNKS